MAVVTGRAEIIVITRTVTEQMQAALYRVATIDGADVVIVAIRQPGVLACSILTDLTRGALVSVITCRLIGGMGALTITIARIIRAGIAIIAIQCFARDAGTIDAGIIQRTGIAIVAGSGVNRPDTTGFGSAAISRAWISVVTIGGSRPNALTVDATINRSTRVPIIASHSHYRVKTPGLGVADVIGTWIVVSADQRWPPHANPGFALVIGGTNIPIITVQFIGNIHAPIHDITGVVGAGISIVAVRRHATGADTAQTSFANST